MVEGYEGRPGAGKTATMVARAWKAKQRGKPVFANIPLVDRRKKVAQFWGFGKKSTKPVGYGQSWSDGLLVNLEECLSLDNALVLLDEVHMWMGATEWSNTPFEVRQYLAQQRKVGIDIWWTAQSNARVFNVLRELTAFLYSCQRYGLISVMTCKDPISKEDYGKRYVWLGPQIWGLYDTEYMVGDRTGAVAGTYGHNAKYHKLVEDPLERQFTRQVVHGGTDLGACYVAYARSIREAVDDREREAEAVGPDPRPVVLPLDLASALARNESLDANAFARLQTLKLMGNDTIPVVGSQSSEANGHAVNGRSRAKRDT